MYIFRTIPSTLCSQVARSVGINHVRASCMPEQKVALVQDRCGSPVEHVVEQKLGVE